ncbi:MAG: L-threonylcarbamoyladenylate synthase, partial [Pseudomonadota bacterium]
MQRLEPDASGIQRAVELLRSGELVAFPTETVYGLGGDAMNDTAVQAIFKAKGRPADHPLIVHLPNAESMHDWASNESDRTRQLAEVFWPGPLAMVVNKQASVSNLITGGQDTVGLRVPEHPVAQQLLQAFGGALAAPSANRFGRISPTTAEHVLDEFSDASGVAAVIDGGACRVGVESTIIDLSVDRPRLLRPGMIAASEIESVLNQPLTTPDDSEGPRVSGRLESHYAPTTPLHQMAIDHIVQTVSQQTSGLGVIALHASPEIAVSNHWVFMPLEPVAYATRLYDELRKMDAMDFEKILVEQP